MGITVLNYFALHHFLHAIANLLAYVLCIFIMVCHLHPSNKSQYGRNRSWVIDKL